MPGIVLGMGLVAMNRVPVPVGVYVSVHCYQMIYMFS